MVDKLDELLKRQIRKATSSTSSGPSQPAQAEPVPPSAAPAVAGEGGQPPQVSSGDIRQVLRNAQSIIATPSVSMQYELPPAPKDLEDTGLTAGFLSDLILKHLYFENELKSIDVAQRLGLPFGGVTEPILDFLKADRSIEIRGGTSTMSFTWRYVLSGKGVERAKDALNRSYYVGKAPVSMSDYTTMVNLQAHAKQASYEEVKEAYADLIVTEDLLKKVGPAVSSNKSIFMYGPPGNGKTSIAERIFKVLGGSISVPTAIEVDGHVIKLHDPFYHLPIATKEPDSVEAMDKRLARYDCRWNLSARPFVVVGGELTLETLDLIWNDSARFYEAPFQLKSNGGILLIDDFGRQVVKPQDLLNRWIVPLEKGVDYLTLHTGKKFEVPFKQLVVFSTNLNPADLVDDAFLRRLRYKIEIPNPDFAQYEAIFRKVSAAKGVQFTEDALRYLMTEKYGKLNRDPRSCHPRDLLDIIIDEAKFRGVAPALSNELIDYAWSSYFVSYD